MGAKGANNIVRGNFAKAVLQNLRSRADGSDSDRIYDDKPSKILFIGNLSPRKSLSALSSIYSQTSPSVTGFEVLISKELLKTAKVQIRASSVFYYKVFPTLEEQREISDYEKLQVPYLPNSAESSDLSNENSYESRRGNQLRTVYKKATPPPVEFVVCIGDLVKDCWHGSGYFQECENLALEALQIFNADPAKYRERKRTPKGKTKPEKAEAVPDSALFDENTFNEFLDAWGDNVPKPHWKTGLFYKITEFNDECFKLTLTLENLVEEEREKQNIDNFLFETSLSADPINFNFTDYVLEYLKDDYHYDGNIHANGINCATQIESGNAVKTEHMPLFIQHKYKSQEPVELSFEILANDPIPLLEELLQKMDAERVKLETQFKEKTDLSEEGKHLFCKEIDLFNVERGRFENGIEILKSDSEAFEAFVLMNKTFAMSGKGYSTWRLFQIVFIVMEIPDILASSGRGSSETENDVDLIYFPTGGGKTEAYLGLVVFTMFFDRLRGKKEGVTAITRFPLRLLSLQQLQRISDIFAQAEILRRKHTLIGKKDYAQFSTGYYVGERNTPNKVFQPTTQYGGLNKISPINEDSDLQEKYKIISTCPFCGSKNVDIKGDLSSLRIIHQCKNPECGEEIPVYISDQEVYRYLPTFIISTLDKMASAAWSKEFKSIFGQVSGRCPKHGYYVGKECLYKSDYSQDPNKCTVEKYLPVNLIDPTPTLMIQDEMHLIRESLGTYDSHYETFLDHYIQKISGGKKIKIIGSSATMTEYWDQVRQLYLKDGHQFPSGGSFYAEEDSEETARLIAGVMPHNRTVIFSVLDIIRMYYEEIDDLKRNPSKALKMDVGFTSKDEVSATLKDYDLQLSYNLVKLEGDAISQSIKSMVNPSLKRRGIKEMDTARMTGDVTFSDVKQVLSVIEDESSEKNLDLLVATSMISHGVDIDKLNFMVFRGMPRNTAEYIQAYSRIGRRYPGIIIVVFNPARERDLSYYKYFEKYHEFKDMLVEPVPLNRWAKFSIERTLPGIFCAYILNYLKDSNGISPYMSKHFTNMINSREISENQIIEFVLECYRCNEGEMSQYFENFIRSKIRDYIDEIQLADENKFIPMLLSETPMNSLRETDIQIEIVPTRESYHPMQQVSAKISRSVD